MRLIWKFSVIVLVTVGIQWTLVRGAGDIDEAAFIVRVAVSKARGGSTDDQHLLDEAFRLFERQCDRARASEQVAPISQNLVVASASDR